MACEFYMTAGYWAGWYFELTGDCAQALRNTDGPITVVTPREDLPAQVAHSEGRVRVDMGEEGKWRQTQAAFRKAFNNGKLPRTLDEQDVIEVMVESPERLRLEIVVPARRQEE